MSLQTVAPTNLAGSATATDLTAALAAGTLGGGVTGILFQNTGHELVFVQTNSSGNTTDTSDIGVTIQGQAVPGIAVTEAASKIYIFGTFSSQFNKTDGTNDIEMDFGTPADIAGVVVLHVPGAI